VSAVALDSASIEAVAHRVAELLRGEDVSPELADAAEIARRFGVSRDYVYEHAVKLGAVKLGDGPRARLRFDPERVREALSAAEPAPATSTRRRRTTGRGAVELLPVRDGGARCP